jgi:7-cyano-7-deazaguanine synthase
VLLSGGLDSATVLAIARREGFACHALSFDYGQRHRHELEAARRVAAALGAMEHRIVRIDLTAAGGFGRSALTDDVAVPKDRDLPGVPPGPPPNPVCEIRSPRSEAANLEPRTSNRAPHSTSPLSRSENPSPESETANLKSEIRNPKSEIPVTYVPARNTIFLSIALGYAEVIGALDLFIGVNAVDYSGYPDCRPEFIESFQALANLATAVAVEGRGRFIIHAPLIRMTKARIIRTGLDLGVDYSLTHSCYDPAEDGAACGRCDSCRLRLAGFAAAGARDPGRYQAPDGRNGAFHG